MNQTIYPLLFTPVYKDYIWGGNRISQTLNRKDTPDTCAESWEIADRPEGMSIVSNGPLAGKTIHELIESMGKDLLGSSCNTTVFPLLIKIIDANKDLSVQVHPSDEASEKYGGEAKTEMWYNLGNTAQVFTGLKPGTTNETLEEKLQKENVKDLLRKTEIKKGEAVFIPGGRIHAIVEKCLILEIQQNSNTTYRLYDWGRLGKDGKPRELHIEQAMKAINWDDSPASPIKPTIRNEQNGNTCFDIISNPYFKVGKLHLSTAKTTSNDGKSFQILFTESGEIKIEGNNSSEQIPTGTSCLIPAAMKGYTLTPVNGTADVIQISR